MVALLKDRRNRMGAAVLAVIAALAAVGAYTSVALSGTKTGLALAIAAIAGPALAYAALTVPLVFPFASYAILTPFDNVLNFSAFGTLTRLLGIAAAAALLFFMLRSRRFVQPHRSLALWLLLYLWMLASMFWAMDISATLVTLPTAIQLFGLYVIVSMFPAGLRGLKTALIASVLGGVLAAIYGIYMFHNGIGYRGGDRLSITAGSGQVDPNHFAAALLLPIAIVLLIALWSHNLRTRILSIASFAVMLIALILSGSRGASLGLVAMVVYLLIRDRHRWQLGATAALFGVAALGANWSSVSHRWALAGANGGAGRLAIWKVGWRAFQENWLLGAGYNNFPQAYNHAYINVYQSFVANWSRASHNVIIGTAVELGVVGAILLVLAWYGQFRMLSNIQPESRQYPVRLALESSLIGLFVAGFFLDLMIEKYVWLAFMLVALARNAVIDEKRSSALATLETSADRPSVAP
jgi:O-antigen ligase